MYPKTSAWLLTTLTIMTVSCADSAFRGGGDLTPGKVGEGNGIGTDPNQQHSSGTGSGDIWGQGQNGWIDPNNPLGSVPPYFQDRPTLDTQDQDTNLNLYVPLNVHYEGEYSGDDAQFTFYVARVAPIRDRREVEIIKSVRKQFISNSIPKFCRCGYRNDLMFLWKHVRGRMGALHTYYEGEWLHAHHVSDKGWLSDGLKGVPQGPHTMFFGADTENPAFIGNSTGEGYLRTETYNPNSNWLGNIFGVPDKKNWGNRDDMRLALSCDISQCPSGMQAGTSIEFLHHPSMVPNP